VNSGLDEWLGGRAVAGDLGAAMKPAMELLDLQNFTVSELTSEEDVAPLFLLREQESLLALYVKLEHRVSFTQVSKHSERDETFLTVLYHPPLVLYPRNATPVVDWKDTSSSGVPDRYLLHGEDASTPSYVPKNTMVRSKKIPAYMD